jgi:carbamate kinase
VLGYDRNIVTSQLLPNRSIRMTTPRHPGSLLQDLDLDADQFLGLVAGRLAGIEAVVDKDLTAAALAISLAADRLLVLTDVPAVMRDFGTPAATPIRTLDTAALAGLSFPAGSMGPKIAACAEFAAATGHPAAIGALADAAAILAGQAGTTITAAR